MASAKHRGPMFKIVLLGEVGVGKTSLFLRLKNGDFRDPTEYTVNVDSCSYVLNDVLGEQVKFSVWDTAGVERFRTLTQNYYRSTDVSVLMYDVSDDGSFRSLPNWIQDAENNAPNALKVLVGNKCDLESKIDEQSIVDLENIYSMDCDFKLSAKTGQGVREAMETIAKMLVQQMRKNSEQKAEIYHDTVNLEDEKKKTNCSC